MADERKGTVLIAEDHDPNEPFMCAGTFSAHWEPDDTGDAEPVFGPEGVSADEAIAWGRGQADVVLIRLGDTEAEFSAGTRHPEATPDSDPLPLWRDGTRVSRRRWSGKEYLDVRSAEPVPWEVTLRRAVSRFRARARAGALRSSLEDDPQASDVSVTVERPERVARATGIRTGRHVTDAVLRFTVGRAATPRRSNS